MSPVVIKVSDGAPWWVPILTLVGGGVLTYLANSLRDQRSHTQATAVRREAVAIDRENRAYELQREAFIELQETLSRLSFLVTEFFVQAVARRTAEPDEEPPALLRETWIAEYQQSSTHARLLAERIIDEELRRQVRDFMPDIVSIMRTAAEGDPSAESKRLNDAWPILNADLGKALRDLLQHRGLEDADGGTVESRKLIRWGLHKRAV